MTELTFSIVESFYSIVIHKAIVKPISIYWFKFEEQDFFYTSLLEAKEKIMSIIIQRNNDILLRDSL